MTDFKDGDTVRVKASGEVGTLTDINPNPNYKDEGEYWAEVELPDYYSVEIQAPDEIEPAELSSLPTVKEILDNLDVLGSNWANDNWSLIETGEDSDNSMYVIGRTRDGQEFTFNLTITTPERHYW